MVAEDGTAVLACNVFGSVCMSCQEVEALRMMTEGLRTSEIAQALNMTVRSFQNVRRGLFAKLGARTQEHAAAIAFRRGLLQLDRRSSGD